MVLRAGNGMWQVSQAELAQSWKEARQLLPTKCSENHFCGLGCSSARYQHQD
jgi:hypothetical protein